MIATPFPFVVWSALLLTVAAIDAGAYLVAAGRAQGAADAAALAAVAVEDARPVAAAAQVADANHGRLESCRCRAGAGRSEVAVSVAVPGLFIPRVNGMRRVTGTAQAQLTRSPP